MGRAGEANQREGSVCCCCFTWVFMARHCWGLSPWGTQQCRPIRVLWVRSVVGAHPRPHFVGSEAHQAAITKSIASIGSGRRLKGLLKKTCFCNGTHSRPHVVRSEAHQAAILQLIAGVGSGRALVTNFPGAEVIQIHISKDASPGFGRLCQQTKNIGDDAKVLERTLRAHSPGFGRLCQH